MVNITYNDYNNAIISLSEKIKINDAQFNALYPIPRGGYYPAIKLSELLHLPILSQDDGKITTLIVDDIVDSGETFKPYAERIKAAVYAKPYSVDKTEYYGEIQEGWLSIPDEKDCGIENHIRRIIEYVGEDASREGLIETPQRIIRMWKEIFRGYDPTQKPKITTFANEQGIEDIVFDTGKYYSMCEHHILPFFGHYYFAYIPSKDGRILGLSKITRVVAYCSAKMQLQERLVCEIVEMLSDALNGKALGFALLMRGQHLCKAMRGAKSDGCMTSAHLTGEFLTNAELRKEFYNLVKIQGGY